MFLNTFKKIKSFVGNRKIFVINFSLYSLQSAVNLGLSFFSTVFVSRYLGPINLGIYSFSQNIVAIFTVFINGLDFRFAWLMASSEDKLRVVSDYFVLRAIFSSVFTFIILGFCFVFLPKDVALYSSLMLISFVINFYQPLITYLQFTNGDRK